MADCVAAKKTHKSDMETVYDRFAQSYDAGRDAFNMDAVLEDFFSVLGSGSGALLDLGCGAGVPFDDAFVQRGWSVTGVDFSEPMLELARRNVPQMETLRLDMRSADFGAGSFQAAIAAYSLFHIPAEDQFTLLERIFGWLHPGGKLLFTYATREYTGSDSFDGYKEFMGQRLFYSHRTPQELFARLDEIGFELLAEDYREIGGETFLWVTAGKPASVGAQ